MASYHKEKTGSSYKNIIIMKLMLHGKLVLCEHGYTVIFTERHFQRKSKM